MSTYLKPGKALEFDNAPDWLVAYMQYRRVMLGNTENSIMTDFKTLREYLQWLAAYQKNGRSPGSVDALRKIDILDIPLENVVAVKRNDVETYLYFCADTLGNGPATRNKKLVAVRCLYNYLLDQEAILQTGIEYNPADRIKNPKTPKKQPIYLPEEERNALLGATDATGASENGIRDHAILLLMLTCGLRVSEVVSINKKDVNLTAGTIKIHGKGNKERIANPTRNCLDALEEYQECYRAPALQANAVEDGHNVPFFISRRTGSRLTTRAIEKMMQKHINAAGIGGMGYTPHKLRHTTATILAKDGVDLLAIQQILGHESPTTTQIYTHLGSEDLERAVNQSSLVHLGSKE